MNHGYLIGVNVCWIASLSHRQIYNDSIKSKGRIHLFLFHLNFNTSISADFTSFVVCSNYIQINAYNFTSKSIHTQSANTICMLYNQLNGLRS